MCETVSAQSTYDPFFQRDIEHDICAPPVLRGYSAPNSDCCVPYVAVSLCRGFTLVTIASAFFQGRRRIFGAEGTETDADRQTETELRILLHFALTGVLTVRATLSV